MIEDEDLLLDTLNSTPRRDGVQVEHLDPVRGAEFARRHGGIESEEEVRRLRRVRDALQAVIRGDDGADSALQALLGDVRLTPTVVADGIRWELSAPDDRMLAARLVRAWSIVAERMPGRLKACANQECNLFLIDRTRPGTAKWCSMATCGNRMKARTHAARRRAVTDGR